MFVMWSGELRHRYSTFSRVNNTSRIYIWNQNKVSFYEEIEIDINNITIIIILSF